MARLREETVGWLYTISGLQERSFPIGIKNVNMKELAVIFPLLMLGISFAFKNIMLAMAFIAPVFFFVFYEEKSMDEFSYVYHFLKFYISDLIQPNEKAKKTQKQTTKIDIMPIISKYVDYGLLGTGALMTLISLPNAIKIFEFVELPPYILLETEILFGIGAGLLAAEIIILITKRLKKKK
ncbi:hypothetical protein [Sulfuracidifex tepidarius]|uniref:Uncharacterized protein n=1 Tax=Sulfuracidifex tepidarius TaxID=1294262 RepID=A0A510E481_9CREN|nr:hypothetical protein [Sulfuracidifex tepidarius]BBG27299.1 hypothetical protein IC007_1844 [Sulfuracidifex tepidarius]